MKRRLASILICICLAATALLSACDLFKPTETKPVKLATPSVTVDANGNASWAKVANAGGYVYKIDNGAEQAAASQSVALTNGQSITVKAVGDGKKFTDSDWSVSKKYTQQTVVPTPTKLSAPVVSIDANGNASWAKVANAGGYVYKIDNGAEQTATSNSVTLTDGQSITVKAVGDGENYTDSDWSVSKTFTGQSACNHIDEDGDGTCDNCNESFVCAHADADNNNVCDNCKRSLLVNFNFYAINDLHGMYADSDTQPGVDELTTYLLDAQKNSNSLVLSSGDMWQGSSESNNTKGKLATEWLNYVNCSAMTLGNHEFDWSTDKIRENAQLADFPFLAINVYEHSTNQRAPYCQASVTVTLQGVKIGIIGAIGDCYGSISSSMCKDVYFKTGSELTALVRAEAERLRNDGVNYIIYSIHDGDGQTMNHYDESLSNGLINVVFEGHSHRSYCIDDSYGVYHVQAGGYNAGISHAYVTYNILTEQSDTTADVINNNVYRASESDSIINNLIEKYSDEIGNPNEVVGHITAARDYDTLRNDMAAAYWAKGQKEWGSQYKIAVAGGYISVRNPGNLKAGDILVRDIQTIFPFDNRMHLCSIKGSDLLARYFQNTSYVYRYDAEIRAKLESGQGLNDTYYIVTDSYNTDFALNNLTMVEELGDDVFPRTVLIEYIKDGGYGSSAPDTPTPPEPAERKTIAELLAIGEALSDNAETTVEYSVSGVIKSIVNETYGNCYITDDENELYVYGLYDESGTRYDKLTNKPVAGNSVVFSGKIKRHVKSDGTIVIEMINAKIISSEN